MEKKHAELLAVLQDAEARAVAIEKDGGSVQSVIHHVRAAQTLVGLRLTSYKDSAAAKKEDAPKK